MRLLTHDFVLYNMTMAARDRPVYASSSLFIPCLATILFLFTLVVAPRVAY